MTVIAINADWIIYHHFIPLRETMDQCKIAFLYFSVLELCVQQFVRITIFRKDYHATSLFV